MSFRLATSVILFSITCVQVTTTLGGGKSPEKKAPLTIEAVVNAWTDRQERFKAFDITYESHVQWLQEDKRKDSGLARLCGDLGFAGGEVLRLDTNINDSLVETVTTPVANYRLQTPHFGSAPRENRRDFPHMMVYKRPDNMVAAGCLAIPLLVFVRPIELSRYDVFVEAKDLKIVDADSTIDGRSCLRVAAGKWELWLDPERDYIPLRFISKHGNGVQFICNLAVRRDPQLGYVPDSWRSELLPYLVYDAKVKSIATKLANPEATLKIAPPIGTLVDDLVAAQRYIIVRKGKRLLTSEGYSSYNLEDFRKENPEWDEHRKK